MLLMAKAAAATIEAVAVDNGNGKGKDGGNDGRVGRSRHY
jgi:hypothetical protein